MDSKSITAHMLIVAVAITCLQAFPYSFIVMGIGVFLVLITLGFEIFGQAGQKTHFNINFVSVGAGLLLIYYMLSVLWSPVPFKTMEAIPKYALMPLIVLVVSCTGTTLVNLKNITTGMAILGALLGFGSLFQYFMNDGLFSYIARYPFFNPNSLAVILGLCFIATMHGLFADDNKKSHRALFLHTALVIIALALFTVHSRLAVFSLGAVIVLTLVLGSLVKLYPGFRQFLKMMVLFVIPFVAMGITGMIVYKDVTKEKTAIELSSDSPQVSILSERDSERLYIWEGSLQAAKSQNIFLGSGVGTYSSVYAPYRESGDISSGLHAHNDIIHLLVELGVSGLIIYMLMGLGVVIGLVKSLPNEGGNGITASLAFGSLFFLALCAQLTTVVLLVPAMIYAGWCFSVFVGSDFVLRSQCYVPWLRSVLLVVIALVGLLVMQSVAVNILGARMKSDVEKSDFSSLRAHNNLLDSLSFGLHPAVPTFRASMLLGLIDSGMIGMQQNANAVNEVQLYIDDAKRRNPLNPESYYYQAELEKRLGNDENAIHNYERALTLDSRYLSARMGLAKILEKNDPQAALEVLKDGLGYSYWRQDPITYFSYALIMANMNGDDAAAQTVRSAIQRHSFATDGLRQSNENY